MRQLSTASALLALGLLAPAGASAQQAAGGNGRALDANPRVGGGAANPLNPALDFSARNLLITGQVTEGRQFRGDPGFEAAGAFGGSLGSDDLFRFRAESVGAGSLVPPSVRFGRGGGVGGSGSSNIIFNNFFVPSAANGGLAPARTVISPDGGAAQRVGGSRPAYNPGLIGVGDQRIDTAAGEAFDGRDADRRPGADTVGRIRGTDGRQLQVDASPLFGVSESELRDADGRPAPGPEEQAAPGLDLRRTTAGAPSARPGATAVPGGGLREGRLGASDPFGGARDSQRSAGRDRNGGVAPRVLGSDDADVAAAPGLPREAASRLPGSPDPEAAGVSGGDAEAGRFSRGGVPLAVQLGAQLNPVLREAGGAGGVAGGRDARADRLERLREQIFRPLQNPPEGDAEAEAGAEDADPYLELLRRLRDGEQRPQEARPAWMRDLAGVPDEVLDTAEGRRERSIQQLLQSLRGGDDDGAGAGAEGDAAGEEAQALASQLGYDGPRLETLRGNRETRINESLKNAEAALAEGRYFDAESLYRQVVTDSDNGQPLARVGLVHAQMAAGMNRSAALSLRNLFNDHPELISTRYAERLLPPADRMAWLRDDLQKLIDDPRSPRAEPALMLAYVGRQVESRELVRYGLALAEEARPADPLFSLLRAAWLGGGGAAPAAEGK